VTGVQTCALPIFDLKGLVRFYDEQLPLEAAARSGNIAQTKVEGTASTPPG
jgi:hypothetical protein